MVIGLRLKGTPRVVRTASCPATACSTNARSNTSPPITFKRTSCSGKASGWRVTAVTVCPESRACFVKILPVAPFAPKMTIFIIFSFLVFYLHNQVILFPMSRDSFVMTTTCGHHKERGLSCPFWDKCQSGFAYARHLARPLKNQRSEEGSAYRNLKRVR